MVKNLNKACHGWVGLSHLNGGVKSNDIPQQYTSPVITI